MKRLTFIALLLFALCYPIIAQETWEPVDNTLIYFRSADRGTGATSFKQGDVEVVIDGWNPKGYVLNPIAPGTVLITLLLSAVPHVGGYVRIDNEVMTVQQVVSIIEASPYKTVELSVLRAQLGSAAVDHAANAAVKVVRHPFLPPTGVQSWYVRVWGANKAQLEFLTAESTSGNGRKDWQLRQQNVPSGPKNFFLSKQFLGFGASDDQTFWGSVVTGDYMIFWDALPAWAPANGVGSARTWLYNKTTRQTA